MADHEPRPTRRIVFHGLGALGVAVALAGCGSDNAGSTMSGYEASAASDPAFDRAYSRCGVPSGITRRYQS